MEGSPVGGSQHYPKEQEFTLREWHLRARISRENTSSRRYSASFIRSFREEPGGASFKSNFTISSTASSPGYNLKDEIDPSTYSFTTALKALQAKSGYVWECLSPEGFALNSKWDEAERYICNPLSGEVPMECLSAKTLSGRSFRSNNMSSRVTMSAPLVYSLQPRRTTNSNNNKNIPCNYNPPPFVAPVIKEHLVTLPSFQQEEKKITRDVGTQSTPPEGSSTGSPSPTSTPSIKERKINCCDETTTEDGDTLNSSSSIKYNYPVDAECTMQVEVKVTREGEETKRRTKESGQTEKKKKGGQICGYYYCSPIKVCFQFSSWACLRMNKRRERKLQAPAY